MALASLLAGCSDTDFHSTPSVISRFITQYWPGALIESCVQNSDHNWLVTVNDGPSLTFNSSYSWIEIDGNGMPLPGILLYDQLPPALYNFIESESLAQQVFSIKRDAKSYTVSLLDSSLLYNISTQKIEQY